MPKIEIVPSILSADLTRLGEQVKEAEAAGADRIQVDVMDGRFVPNITFGPLVVEAVRRSVTLPVEAHLMIVEPGRYVADFASAGADVIIVHQEAAVHLHRIIEQIHQLGKRAGVALNPSTRDDGQPRLWRPKVHRKHADQDRARAADDGRAWDGSRRRSRWWYWHSDCAAGRQGRGEPAGGRGLCFRRQGKRGRGDSSFAWKRWAELIRRSV
jgi:hypothetical protein